MQQADRDHHGRGPVDDQLSGINRVPVNSSIGMTFLAAFSALHAPAGSEHHHDRRDPRFWKRPASPSTPDTGHLSPNWHTNDAPGAIARLIDIGIKPFLVSSSVRAVLAQRLVRRLCSKCKEPSELTPDEAKALRIEQNQISEGSSKRLTAARIVAARVSRAGWYFELFNIDDEVRHMIINGASTMQLRALSSRVLGTRTLREDGVRKALAGLTTAEEVITTTMSDID